MSCFTLISPHFTVFFLSLSITISSPDLFAIRFVLHVSPPCPPFLLAPPACRAPYVPSRLFRPCHACCFGSPAHFASSPRYHATLDHPGLLRPRLGARSDSPESGNTRSSLISQRCLSRPREKQRSELSWCYQVAQGSVQLLNLSLSGPPRTQLRSEHVAPHSVTRCLSTVALRPISC